MKYILRHQISKESVTFGLYAKSLLKEEPFLEHDWLSFEIKRDGNKPIAPAVIAQLQELERQNSECRHGHEITVSHEEIITLSDSCMNALGLPPAVPQSSLREDGNITGDSFRLKITYEKQNGEPIRAMRHGAFLFNADDTALYRLSPQMFDIAKIKEQLDQTEDKDTRFCAVSELNNIIPNAIEVNEATGYLKNLRIYHATAFSLDLTISVDGINFDPVLFDSPSSINTDDEIEVEELEMYGASELLPPDYQQVFAEERFPKQAGRKTYMLDNGVYVFCDTELKDALDVVHTMRSQDAETKKAFIKSPKTFLRSVLEERLGEEQAELIADGLFVEDFSGYSGRVLEVGLWEPPVLPWVKKVGEQWIPDSDSFGIKVGSDFIDIQSTELEPFYNDLKAAQEENIETISFKGKEVPVDGCLDALSHLPFEINPFSGVEGQPENDGLNEPDSTPYKSEPKPRHSVYYLKVKESFDEVTYGETEFSPRCTTSELSLPSAVKSTPKPYQRVGVEWLQNSYKSGVSGALLADDMGLGKTFQVLCFLAWLKSFRKKEPILIVAPTSLLKNWEKESEIHLHPPYLGNICRLYATSGGELKRFKQESGGNDLTHGRPTLDVPKLREQDWIVVSYETMRDYEHSFGKIRFSCIVFDEIQKLKNPRALMTAASKALNSDFYVGLTGTPVENRLSDLHTISDVIRPGFLGSLKDFSTTYEREEARSALLELKERIEQSQDGIPAFMQRRLKRTALDDGSIPKKYEHLREEPMPPEQAEIYKKTINEYKASEEAGAMLKALQNLRSISLHPYDPSQGHPSGNGSYGDDPEYFQQSARLRSTFRILDEIKGKNEKVIIFLDSKKLQPALKAMIARRYGIQAPYIINGDSKNRQTIVDEFQNANTGFDVIILSPRAAGVGLTITAANHVIHLSRWWNPAVEDQATDRAYRLGQKKDVHVYYPIAYHPDMHPDASFDNKLHSLISKKRELSNELLMPVTGADADKRDAEELCNSIFGAGANADNFSSYEPVYNRLSDFDRMTPQEFERWIAKNFSDAGYDVNLTRQTRDFGVDVCASKDSRRVFIQAKHTVTDTDNACRSNPAHELMKAYEKYGCDADYFVVTNHARFNKATTSYAKLAGMTLIARADLLKVHDLITR